MKLKKNIACLLAFLSAASAITFSDMRESVKINAANSPQESYTLFSNDEMTIVSADSETISPNNIIVDEMGFNYTVQSDGTLYITDYSTEDEHVIVPSEIDGKKVAGINIHDENGYKHTDITISESIKYIGYSMCVVSNLEKIIVDENNKTYASLDGVLFDKNLKTLMRYPAGKAQKEPVYTIPDNVTSINTAAFECCNMTAINVENNDAFSCEDGVLFNKDKTELYLYPRKKSGTEYTIPKTVNVIKGGAFSDCDELANVILQEGVNTIEEFAFNSCTYITSVNIPSSVETIENGAFAYSYLESINIDKNNKNYFTEDGVLFNKDKSTLLLYPPKKAGDTYVIPDTVKILGRSAFASTEISEIIFGKNVSIIESSAFWSAKNIQSIVFPNSIKEIKPFAFPYCDSLSSVTIPAGIEIMANVTEDTNNYNGLMNYGNNLINIFMNCSNLVIHGTPDTVAEKYALFWGITFNENPVLYDESSDTGVNVMLTEGAVPEGTELKVEKKSSDEYAESTVYDISLTLNGKAVQPKSTVSVRIPISTGTNGSQLKVYYRDKNGTLTDMKAVVSGDYIVFITDHFSEYIVTKEKLIPDIILGDINSDGKINTADARWVLQCASGKRTLTDSQKAAADVNNDGKINTADAKWLLQVASGKRQLG